MKKRSLLEYRKDYKKCKIYFSISSIAFLIALCLCVFAGYNSVVPLVSFGILLIGAKIELTEILLLAARFYEVDLSCDESEEDVTNDEEALKKN